MRSLFGRSRSLLGGGGPCSRPLLPMPTLLNFANVEGISNKWHVNE